MSESTEWGLRRYLTLLAVLTLHMALLAVLVLSSGMVHSSAPATPPIELLFISPASFPKIHAQNTRPHRSRGDPAAPIALPVPDSPSSSLSPPISGSDGNGSGVDWAAEARRALQAFEIRSHRPSSNESVSGTPQEDTWWPRTQHHAGDQFKTPSGDWIVWINSSCYQVASSAPSVYALGATLPETVCVGDSSTRRAAKSGDAHAADNPTHR